MTWYRLHYRKGRPVLVEGEAERDRLKAKRAPKVIGVEVATLHTCSVCGTEGPWTDNWSWYGSYAQLDDGKPVRKFCSALCRDPKAKRVPADNWRATQDLNRSDPADRFERWRIHQRDRDAQRETRKFPMPVFPKSQTGPGWCRWCGEQILHTEGPRAGEVNKRRSWHSRCKRQYFLHTDARIQFDFLCQRDGHFCAVCSEPRGHWIVPSYASPIYYDWGYFDGDGWWTDRKQREAAKLQPGFDETIGAYTAVTWVTDYPLEVDHIIPLWKRWDYPDEEHRMLFSPENLWLLCDKHHKAKSRAEAAERAARKKGGDQ